MPMQRWEYKVISIGKNPSDAEQERIISNMAVQGWKLITASVTTNMGGYVTCYLYFERPKP
jgi:hypothetical protein